MKKKLKDLKEALESCYGIKPLEIPEWMLKRLKEFPNTTIEALLEEEREREGYVN